MQIQTMYKILLKMTKNELEKNPAKKFVSSFGEKIFLKDIYEELKRIVSWLYPSLDSADVQRVIRCKNCKNYKEYTLKEGIKAQKYKGCKFDKAPKSPEFFCKNGVEK